ncbi:MAG: GYF domain-containing protein [Planctomycetaceae bacterium]|nr:GYF domain-containing protein [Planctomycetaceae bacterium]
MAAWYYYDNNGNKIGPVRGRELKQLALQGTVTPETVLESSEGRILVAGNASHLTFAEAPPLEIVPDEAFAISPISEERYDSAPVPSISIMPDVEESNPPPLSRAVFIFLAVFVGLFGVHDFYGKRVREGRIHLALLLPWMFLILVSILMVFGYSLYALIPSSIALEIRKCQTDLKDNEKKLQACEKETERMRQTLVKARRGEIGKIHGSKKTDPQPNETTREIARQSDEPDDQTKKVVPQPDKSAERVATPVVAPRQSEIDGELVEKLEISLQELEDSLRNLEQNQMRLLDKLESLRMQQGARMPAWVSVGPLWFYFFFCFLPFLSWVMAMVEIVYVTKDGTGRALSN